MLDQWLHTLEQERQQAINQVRESCSNDGVVDLAIKEIEINYTTTRHFLRRTYNLGYRVNSDLSSVDEDYDRSENYRKLYNHISHHLAEIRIVPLQVEKGKFEAKFARYY